MFQGSEGDSTLSLMSFVPVTTQVCLLCLGVLRNIPGDPRSEGQRQEGHIFLTGMLEFESWQMEPMTLEEENQ